MTEGGALYVEDVGSGEPVVVCLHGFGGSARNFRGQARVLRERHRVLAYDARGHARSRAWRPLPAGDAAGSVGPYSLAALIEDLAEVCGRAGGRPLVLLGLSLGAFTALRYALEPGTKLAGLVLASLPGPADPSASGWPRRLARAIDDEGLEAAGERFVWGGGRFDAAGARLIREGFLEHDPHALAELARDVLTLVPDLATLAAPLSILDVPTLVIAGELDPPAVSQGRELARLMPRAVLELVPDAGHVVNIQKREQFNALLLRFLSEF